MSKVESDKNIKLFSSMGRPAGVLVRKTLEKGSGFQREGGREREGWGCGGVASQQPAEIVGAATNTIRLYTYGGVYLSNVFFSICQLLYCCIERAKTTIHPPLFPTMLVVKRKLVFSAFRFFALEVRILKILWQLRKLFTEVLGTVMNVLYTKLTKVRVRYEYLM